MVTEVLADHFASIAEGIGGRDAELMSVEDFKNHGSVRCIRDSGNTLAERFEVKPVTQGQVLKALETLKTEKAAGRDGISPKILKLGAKELQRPLTNLFNGALRLVNGLRPGNVGTGPQFTRKMIDTARKIIAL